MLNLKRAGESHRECRLKGVSKAPFFLKAKTHNLSPRLALIGHRGLGLLVKMFYPMARLIVC
jgi:hypothetical protein